MWAAAEAVCDALVAHDMDALRALTTEELWLRAAAEELAPLAEHAVAAILKLIADKFGEGE